VGVEPSRTSCTGASVALSYVKCLGRLILPDAAIPFRLSHVTLPAFGTATALWGMPECFGDFSAWTNVMLPSALIAPRPSVPSDPVPQSTTPMARPSYSCASERKN
jgi:hypothetical protein